MSSNPITISRLRREVKNFKEASEEFERKLHPIIAEQCALASIALKYWANKLERDRDNRRKKAKKTFGKTNKAQ